jgi:hypothetical protein
LGEEGREQEPVFAQAPALGGGTSEVLLDVRLTGDAASNNQVFAVKKVGVSGRGRMQVLKTKASLA